MAVISEDYNSRRFTVGSQVGRELTWTVTGTDDENVVLALLEANAPAIYQGLRWEGADAEALGGGVWKGHVTYGGWGGFENDDQYTFDTGGGSQHITQSLATRARYAPAGGLAPSFQGAIGVTEDSVEGCDVVVPAYAFTETHRFAPELVDLAYKLTVYQLTGKVNLATFKGFAAEEVLFLGATGTKRGDEDWEISFRFVCSPNLTGMSIGSDLVGGDSSNPGPGKITGIAKKGHDYLWIRYSRAKDGTANSLVRRPTSVHVEQVYRTGDFSLLGIGI